MSDDELDPAPEGFTYGIITYCQGESSRLWDVIGLPLDHECFTFDPAPTSVYMGFPIVVQPTNYVPRTIPPKMLDNKIATYLMIDPDTGFAPHPRQSAVGSCIVARKDKQPLDERHFEGVWQYNDMIVDRFGDDPADGSDARMTGAELRSGGIMSKDHFVEWFGRYVERMVENTSRKDFWRRTPPLFADST